MLALIELLPQEGDLGREARREARRLGIDVKAKYGDIRRLTLKFFARVPGIDVEDLVQEVVLNVLRRNGTPSAFNPEKSSLSHYIVMIARNTLANALASRKRHDRVALVPEIPEGMIDSHDPIGAYEHTRDSMRVSKARPLDRDRIDGKRAVLN